MTLSLRHAGALVALASVAILGSALLSQYVGGLQPCVLCIYQRIPYAIAIALGLMVFLLASGRGARSLLALAGLVFLAGAAIAAFHVGVEQHWWAGTAECGGNIGKNLSLEELRAQILDAPIVRCDDVAWSLFGVSMAGYNFLLSLGLAGFALLSAFRISEKTA